MSSRTAHRISLLLALAIFALFFYATYGIGAPVACGTLAKGYAPVIAFELARSVSDLHAIFGNAPSHCRDVLVAQTNMGTWGDSLIFIPLYSFFLIFFFLGLKGRDSFLAKLAIAIVVIAAMADYWENSCLLKITAAPDSATPALMWLHYATSIKWIGLGISAFIGGIILGQRGGLWNNLAFVITALSLIFVGLGISYSASFGAEIGLAIFASWLVFTVVDIREAFRASGKTD